MTKLTPSDPKNVWALTEIMCVSCENDQATRRGLCNACYRRARLDGSLWQYPYLAQKFGGGDEGGSENNILFQIDADLIEELEDVIKWVYEFDFDKLVVGLDEYVEGKFECVLDGSQYNKRIGFGGYVGMDAGGEGSGAYSIGFVKNEGEKWEPGMCTQCTRGEKAHARGMCDACYQAFLTGKGSNDVTAFPVKKYQDNVEGCIYWLLNHFFEDVQRVGKFFYGVEISRL